MRACVRVCVGVGVCVRFYMKHWRIAIGIYYTIIHNIIQCRYSYMYAHQDLLRFHLNYLMNAYLLIPKTAYIVYLLFDLLYTFYSHKEIDKIVHISDISPPPPTMAGGGSGRSQPSSLWTWTIARGTCACGAVW